MRASDAKKRSAGGGARVLGALARASGLARTRAPPPLTPRRQPRPPVAKAGWRGRDAFLKLATASPSKKLTPHPLPPPPFLSLSIPDGLAQCKSEWATVRRTWAARRDLPLAEAGMYALFAGEVFAWFCVGEIVGRGFTFGGYAV